MANFPMLKVLSWAPNDPITSEKLNDMVNNDALLDQNMIRGFYTGPSGKITMQQQLRIACGTTLIAARAAASAAKEVSFGDFFSATCQPIVTTGIVSNEQRQLFVTIDGPGTVQFPNRTGFTAQVYAIANKDDKQKISRSFYVTWIAMGY